MGSVVKHALCDRQALQPSQEEATGVSRPHSRAHSRRCSRWQIAAPQILAKRSALVECWGVAVQCCADADEGPRAQWVAKPGVILKSQATIRLAGQGVCVGVNLLEFFTLFVETN